MYEQGNGVDLSRLNEAERQVLRLLAEGHTAKSVANELGSTPAAVNERLREARRKTGAGSSRELARLLKSQEIRHDEMGVVSPSASADPASRPSAHPRRRQAGVVAMTVVFLGLFGAIALTSGQPANEGNVVDPLIGTIPSSETAPDRMHQKVRAEPRDADWAPQAERILRQRFSQIEHVGKSPAVLRVLCGTTICEVAGTIDAPEPKGADIDNMKHPLNKAVRELQEKALFDDLKAKGLSRGAGMFGGTAKDPNQAGFIIYFAREI